MKAFRLVIETLMNNPDFMRLQPLYRRVDRMEHQPLKAKSYQFLWDAGDGGRG